MDLNNEKFVEKININNVNNKKSVDNLFKSKKLHEIKGPDLDDLKKVQYNLSVFEFTGGFVCKP